VVSGQWRDGVTGIEVHYFIGLDLGQRADFTAISVVERRLVQRSEFDWVSYARREIAMDARYALLHLERVRLGTPYPRIVERVRDLARSGRLMGRCSVAADATGVGAPVVDLLREADLGCDVIAVTITGGSDPARARGGWRVPKRDLMMGLRVMLENGELRIARGLPEWRRFVEEMTQMRAKVTESARETFGAAAGSHDDLVLAVALACWGARRGMVGEMGRRLV
jgi:hypothetical protein